MQGAYRVGVDIGGTFTDIVVSAGGGALARRKILSTPADYAQAVITGTMAALADLGLASDGPSEVIHATTIATNAILERKGGPCAVVTTRGFRDVLEIGRLRMPELYNLFYDKRPLLVPRRHVIELAERIDAAGRVVEPITEAALRRVVAAVKAAGVPSVAVCFINSHANPAHERDVAAALRSALPALEISISSDILPRPGEYERTSTAMINAYVKPLVRAYLDRLAGRLRDHGVTGPLYIMQCGGGLTSVRTASQQPVTMVESGPAAGVLAARDLAQRLGLDRVIAFDMGGTTAKASLIENGVVHRTTEYEVGGRISATTRLTGGGGYPINLPVIDVAEVGAGGGSIAWLDSGSSLHVGPLSAGASPGPACYGCGGTAPTVTDANVVIGYLNPEAIAGGSIAIDHTAATRAIDTLAAGLRLDRLRTAHGIHLIANAEMVGAIRAVSTQRGRDPRDFALVAFGGSGPLHAVELARAVGLRRVVVPEHPGLFSAIGLLRTDLEFQSTRMLHLDLDDAVIAPLNAALAALRRDVDATARSEIGGADALAYEIELECRYWGQTYELPLTMVYRRLARPDVARLRERFEAEHERTYGHRGGNERVIVVAARLRARKSPGDMTAASSPVRTAPAASPRRIRRAYFGPELGSLETPVIARDELDAAPRPGPLLVEEYDTVVVVPPGCTASRHPLGAIMIDVDPLPKASS